MASQRQPPKPVASTGANLLRVRSPSGMVKVPFSPSDSAEDLYVRTANEFGVDPSHIKITAQPQGPALPRETTPLASFKLKHGDLLHADVAALGIKWSDLQQPPSKVARTSSPAPPPVQEDLVDEYLGKQTGLMVRKPEKEGTFRISDLPIEPYDPAYLKEKKIKHMSFHAFVRKLENKQRSSGVTGGPIQVLQDEVDELARKVQKKDKSTAIKITDLPSAVVLKSQEFRLVDHVEFETPRLMEQFLGGWRATGAQRFGYLFGRYEPHPDVPLGIKAVVSFIYEPPQSGNHDGLELADNDPDESIVNGIAQYLGMRKVGTIFTDLVDDGSGTGRVQVKRHANSFFLSSLEVVFAAHGQLQHPSPSKYSNTGKYGSKFVTVVVSGDPSIAEGNNNNIGLAAYQVSNQAMAMAQAGIIQPTVDHALMRVVKDENRIIPDVLYRYQNEYGTDVTQAAKPTFPVEYLLVNVGHGFPNEQTPALLNTSIPFPIENRVTEVATTEHVFKYIWNARDNLAYALSDFHVLLALAKTGILHLERDFAMLLEALRSRDPSKFMVATQTETWLTLVEMIRIQAQPSPFKAPSPAPAAPAPVAAPVGGLQAAPPAAPRYQEEVDMLLDMGFENEEHNRELLNANNGNLERVLNILTGH